MQAIINRLWSKIIIEELTRFGLVHICLAGGSRSAPLTLSASQNSKIKIHTHFDERALAYMALGIAKATIQPVAIIVTSGTAVANLLPAVVEANLTREKIILLTADRPVELINCGANQAINQINIFANFAESLNLPNPTSTISPRWLLCALDDKLQKQKTTGGVLQINCPFPEPLYFDEENININKNEYLAEIHNHLQQNTPYINYPDYINVLPCALDNIYTKKTLIIVGRVDSLSVVNAQKLAKMLAVPILTDAQAGLGDIDWAHYDLWLQIKPAYKKLSEVELIIQLGGEIVSKRLNEFIKDVVGNGCEYWQVDPRPQNINFQSLAKKYFKLPIINWLYKTINDLSADKYEHKTPQLSHKSSSKNWAEEIKTYSQKVQNLLNEEMINDKNISEINLAYNLNKICADADVFIGNSLIVRLIDMFTIWQEREIFSNRGASGIDGLLATAIGCNRARAKPMVVLLGDVSLLHDINSLALAQETPAPMVIIVINNNGGAIFDFLPVPANVKTQYFQIPHNLNFIHSAQMFNVAYHNPQTVKELINVVRSYLLNGKNCLLVEIQTVNKSAFSMVKQLAQKIQDIK